MPKFRFRTPPSHDRSAPLSSQKTAAAWFRQLPAVDAIGRQQVVMQTIAEACRPGSELHFEQVGAIEFLDAELAADRGRLITQYVEHAEGSTALANRIWQAAYEISRGFIVAYRALLDRALGEPTDPRWKAAIPRLAARLIHFYGTDARVRVLKNEPWIPSKWTELHRIYKRAIDLGIHRAPVGPDATGSGTAPPTIEQEYVAVLLTHLLNTGTLSAAEIDWAAAQVRIWATGLELDDAPRTASGFVVDVGGKAGLVRRTPGETGALLRYLDTRPLAEQLDRGVDALCRLVAADADGSAQLGRQRITILERLRPAVSAEAAPAVPRDPRADVSVSAQVRAGLLRICQELAPSEMHNSAIELAASAGFGTTAAHPENSTAEPSASATAPAPGEQLWRVANRSATGLRLVGFAALGQQLVLGMLIAIREAGAAGWVLGIVRRVTRPTSDKIEAGVSIIASRVIGVALHAKRQAREDMGFVVDGVDLSTIGERFDGLYLPPPSRPRQPLTARTLIIPSSEYAEGRNIILITTRTVYTVAVREALERHPEWTWAVIDIVDRTARD